MTDHQHAAPEPGPGSGAADQRPVTEPQEAMPTPGTAKEPRAHGDAPAPAHPHTSAGTRPDTGAGARPGTGTPADQAAATGPTRPVDQPAADNLPGGDQAGVNKPTSRSEPAEPTGRPGQSESKDHPGPAKSADQAGTAGSAGQAGPTGRVGDPAPTASEDNAGETGHTSHKGPTEAPDQASPTAAADAPAAPSRFRRDRQYKMLGGVCAGLGRHCDMDPVIFRIVLAVLSATGGIGLVFYGFVWLLVPYDDEEENEVRKLLTGRVDGHALAAVLFALVGCGVFLTLLNNSTMLAFAVVVSLLLAGAGYWSQQRGDPDPDPLAAQAAADAPPEPQAPPVVISYPSWWRDPIVKDGTHVGGTGYLWGPQESRDHDFMASVRVAPGALPHRNIRTVREPKPRGPRWIGGWVFLLALFTGALGTGATWEDRAPTASLQTGLACALVVFGLGIAVSAFLGRTGAGSIFLAVVTAGLLACSAALPANISTNWVRTEWTPAKVANVAAQYELGTGVGTLDLSRLKLSKGQTVTTSVEVGAGKVKVVVPPDATVKLDIEVGIGDIQLPGDGREDVDVAPDKTEQLTLSPVKGAKDGGTIAIDLEVGVGQAEVARAAS